MIFKTKKYWISVAVLWIPWLVLGVLSYLLLLQPQARRYAGIHKKFADSNDRVSMARLAAFKDTQQRQQQILTELQERIGEFLVPAEQKDRIVLEISRLAASFELGEYAGKNQSDPWGHSENEDIRIQRLWMTIDFNASFYQFAAFLNAMERNQPAVFIESAGIQRTPEHSDQHKAKLLIAFFTQPEEETSDKTVSRAEKKTKEGSVS